MKHAIVIGSSIAGLLAARVLSDRFERVTILERDLLEAGAEPMPGESRQGVPQGRHGHGLLATGYRVLRQLFPGFEADLRNAGAIFGDSTGDGLWFQHGGYLAQTNGDLESVLLSRALLERTVRERVQKISNVHIQAGVHVTRLTSDAEGRVNGVRLEGQDSSLEADFVLDASGRGSRGPLWLSTLGYAKPAISEISINVAYASRVYRRAPGDLGGNTHLILAPNAPHQKRGGVLLNQEGERWMVTLFGMLGDVPPTTESGFLEFAQSLPTADLYDLIVRAEPLSEISAYRYPSSVRRHYERLALFPEGYGVMGDALCSFNPIFGQGMTVAALEAQALQRSLPGGLEGLGKRFLRRATKIVDIPWTLAAGADLAFPEAQGKRGPEVKFINAYIGRLLEAAWTDATLGVAFHQVSNLVKPPASLFAPDILWRVLTAHRKVTAPRVHFAPPLPGVGD